MTEKTRQRSLLTTKIMPQTASHLRKLDAGFHSNLTQLYGVNWKTILFILPLKERQHTVRILRNGRLETSTIISISDTDSRMQNISFYCIKIMLTEIILTLTWFSFQEKPATVLSF